MNDRSEATGDLTGKIALVTGASAGIGAATAAALSRAGASVTLGGRRIDRLHALAESLPGASLPVELDVTRQGSVDEAIDATVSRFGGLDIVVNNAGVMYTGMVAGGDTDEWERMVRTNLLGNMFVARAALPHLLTSRGIIVQTSSTAARLPGAGSGAYSATKAGVNAFSEALRQEVTQQGVRVVVLEPGFVATELVDHISDPTMRALAAQLQESMTTLQPDDVAAAVLFAVSQPPHVSLSELMIRPTDQIQ